MRNLLVLLISMVGSVMAKADLSRGPFIQDGEVEVYLVTEDLAAYYGLDYDTILTSTDSSTNKVPVVFVSKDGEVLDLTIFDSNVFSEGRVDWQLQ